MPEKEITRQSWVLLIIVPFLVTLAQKLSTFSNDRCNSPSWRDTISHLIVGTISGMLFGLMGCWLTNGEQAAVGAISGFGAVLGIHGVQRMALVLEKVIIKKFE